MTKKQLGLLFLCLAFLITVEQYVTWGVFFEVTDIHHELFITSFALAGVVLLMLKPRTENVELEEVI